MTTTERGLLDAILAEPEDDALRLIYADALEEQGQAERAGLIRLQCAMHYEPQTTRMPYSQWKAMLQRVEHLLTRHAGEWSPWHGKDSAPKAFRVQGAEVTWFNGIHLVCTFRFRRGFVDSVECPLAVWMEHGPQIARQHPLRKVRITDKEPGWVERDPGFDGWTWFEGNTLSESSREHLPSSLFCFLTCRYHPDRGSAKEDLSAACLLWARAVSLLSPTVR